jgi:hypothetical protein
LEIFLKDKVFSQRMDWAKMVIATQFSGAIAIQAGQAQW